MQGIIKLKKKIFNTLKTKVSYLENKLPDATTLIHIHQYNTDKQRLEKQLEMLLKKPDTSGLVTLSVLNIKMNEVERK